MQTISSGTKAHIFRPSQPAVDARKMDPFARILPEAGLFSNNQPIKQREETMKTRLLGALVGLAISFALPTFAQQTNAPNAQLRQQMVALAKKFDDAYNNNDATALAALYAENAVEVTDQGPIYGREAIKKHFADVFQKVHFSNHLLTIDQDSPHSIGTSGNEIWETGEWSCTITVQGQTGDPIQLKGYHSSIAVRENDAWKKQMVTWNVTPAVAAPAQTK